MYFLRIIDILPHRNIRILPVGVSPIEKSIKLMRVLIDVRSRFHLSEYPALHAGSEYERRRKLGDLKITLELIRITHSYAEKFF